MKLLILLSLTLVGCGKSALNDLINNYTEYEDQPHTTDPAFFEYIDWLDLDRSTPIIFNDREKGISGTCTTYTNYKVIEIDPEYWDTATTNQRLELLAHEIGHCDYNLDHNTNILEDGCYESVMYPVNFGGYCWDKHEENYLSIF